MPLIPHTTTLPASNRLIAGHIIGRKDCPALFTCVCNYFSNWGDKWYDCFPSLPLGGRGPFSCSCDQLCGSQVEEPPPQTCIFHHWGLNPQLLAKVWLHLLPPSLHTASNLPLSSAPLPQTFSCANFVCHTLYPYLFISSWGLGSHDTPQKSLPWTLLLKISLFYSLAPSHTSCSSV